MRIATWNVNSVRQRLGHLTQWLTETKPDLVCLQELKCQDEAFPRMEIEAPQAIGHHVERQDPDGQLMPDAEPLGIGVNHHSHPRCTVEREREQWQATLLVDLLYPLMDPRIREQRT